MPKTSCCRTTRRAKGGEGFGRQDRRPGTAYHLDGRHITDRPGSFRAKGEAVAAPAGTRTP